MNTLFYFFSHFISKNHKNHTNILILILVQMKNMIQVTVAQITMPVITKKFIKLENFIEAK